MKRLFYVMPGLDSAEDASFALRTAGVDRHRIHAISRDEYGLQVRHLHAANWIQERDVVRLGERGALLGLATGVLVALLLGAGDAGDNPWLLLAPVLLFTLFGAWEGGFIGWMQENAQVRPFRHAIEAGGCLLMVDVPQAQAAEAQAVMQRLGLDRPALVDTNWILPFHRMAL